MSDVTARDTARPTAGHLLPRGGLLPPSDWAARHRLVLGVLGAHLPVIFGYALATGHPVWAAALALAPIAVGLAAAAAPLPRRLRTVAASLGLLAASAALVHLSGGALVMHFHYFVTVALIAVYEDWLPYLLAIGFVFVEHVIAGYLSPSSVYGAPVAHPWLTALVHAAFVFSASVAHLVWWRYAEHTRAREMSYRRELYDGQRSLQAELRRITTTREDLLATVSHEFRTPLTAIRGAALTLRKHRARIDGTKMDEMLDAVIANTDRLGRLLENMLTAAEARRPDAGEITDVHQVADEVAMLVQAAHAERAPDIAVAISDGVVAVVERAALHQIIANLLDNAIVHAAPHSQAIISAAREDGEVVITVANEAHGVDAPTLAALFEPFTQADSTITRPKQGAGVGLYVVRRLIEVSDGSLTVHSQPGWVSVEVRLPAPESSGVEVRLPGLDQMAAARARTAS